MLFWLCFFACFFWLRFWFLLPSVSGFVAFLFVFCLLFSVAFLVFASALFLVLLLWARRGGTGPKSEKSRGFFKEKVENPISCACVNVFSRAYTLS